MIAKDSATCFVMIGLFHQFRQSVTKEKVITQNHRRRRTCQEILRQKISLGQTIGRGLFNPVQPNAPLAAIAKGAFELGLILRGGDDRNLADIGQHQHRKRIIDHRLIINRQKLFRKGHGNRIKPRSRSTRQNDAFACHRSLVRSASLMSAYVMQGARLKQKLQRTGAAT